MEDVPRLGTVNERESIAVISHWASEGVNIAPGAAPCCTAAVRPGYPVAWSWSLSRTLHISHQARGGGWAQNRG